MIWAADGGHEAVVRRLLRCDDVLVNDRDVNGYSALTTAAERGHTAVLKALLEHEDIDINCEPCAHADTPLMEAAREGHADVMALLLGRGEIDVDESDYERALVLAIKGGHESVIKLLSENKAKFQFDEESSDEEQETDESSC